jgi:hypothetical protein
MGDIMSNIDTQNGRWRTAMTDVAIDVMLFSCVLAFVTGIVLVAAHFLI